MSPKSNIDHPVFNSYPSRKKLRSKAAVEGVSSAVKSECSAQVEVPFFQGKNDIQIWVVLYRLQVVDCCMSVFCCHLIFGWFDIFFSWIPGRISSAALHIAMS